MCNCKQQNLVSIGHLCQQFQRPYMVVIKTLGDAGVKPRMTLNLTPYYDFNESYRALEDQPAMIRGEASADEQ